MMSRIASLVAATAGILALAAGPSSATAPVEPSCPTLANVPCAWHQPTGSGIVGSARINAAGSQLTTLRVEVKIQRAWGSPWETVASATRIQSGSVQVSTPAVTTEFLSQVCATGGPAGRPELQATTCTSPH
ncbi:hypothetical protein AB0D08_39290 [Kitasatospora sp. NPDC048540]|uniref:hypothetical protein n=1 Tax=unclassified Kitasatospora TaxID=2633591 RepID=UPI000B281A49|nr:hypothetical protein [Kitasatospora sp. MBT63]